MKPRTLTSLILAALLLTASPSMAQQQKGESLLGMQTRLVLPVVDLLSSMAWYSRLGWSPTNELGARSDSTISITDGQVRATLTTAKLPGTVISFASRNMRLLKDTLDSLHVSYHFDMKGPTIGELRISSPNGVKLMVRSNVDEPETIPEAKENPICGFNTEFSIGVVSLKSEVQWWESLGFTQVKGGMVPYPFAEMTDGRIRIGLHEDKDIPSLAITYYAKDMEQRIDRLKKTGITIDEEIPTPDDRIGNAIMRSADGQLIFMFEGETKKASEK